MSSVPHSAPTVRRRWLVLAICCCSLFIIGVDTTGVNLALDSIQTDLQAGYNQLQWVLDAYTLVLAAFLMLSGAVADRVGRRRVFQVGLVLFGLGSLACSLAPNIHVLIAARGFQALGGSMLNPVSMSIITNTFLDPRQRAQAIGIWGAVSGLSLVAGPVLGGWLVSAWGWEAIFWLNIPVILVALVASQLFVPESKAPIPRPIDVVGQLAMGVALTGLVFGLIESRTYGWGSPVTLGALTAAALGAFWYAAHARRSAHPVVDLRFFRSRPFTGALLVAVCAFAVQAGVLMLVGLYFQQSRGMTPLEAGLMTLPIAVVATATAPLSGRWVGVHGPRRPLLASGSAMFLAGILLACTDQDSPLWLFLLAFAVYGVGSGMVNAPITQAAVSGMPVSRAGVASAIASTSRQIGVSLGVAVLGAVVFGVADAGSSFVQGLRVGWILVAALGVVVLGVGWSSTTARARHSAEAVAREFAE